MYINFDFKYNKNKIYTLQKKSGYESSKSSLITFPAIIYKFRKESHTFTLGIYANSPSDQVHVH